MNRSWPSLSRNAWTFLFLNEVRGLLFVAAYLLAQPGVF